MNNKNRTLLILEYLWDNTDETHTVSLADITKHLEIHGIAADPRTFRKDITQFTEFGLDIVVDRRVQNRYHIASRHFETPEVKLLIDAVQSSRFITNKKSKVFIKKLAAFVFPNQKQVLKRQLYVDARPKSVNESIYLTVDRIQTAIAEKRKITFQYYDYTLEKKRELRHGGQVYSISPYALIWNNDAYYVVDFNDARSILATFRADRIAGLEIADERIVPKPKDFDVSDYFSQDFTMRSGKECEAELLCENSLMNNIIDRFGEKVHTEIADDGHFKAVTTVSLSNTFYGWIFASEEAINGFAEILRCYVEKI